jgi:hypothetical protein
VFALQLTCVAVSGKVGHDEVMAGEFVRQLHEPFVAAPESVEHNDGGFEFRVAFPIVNIEGADLDHMGVLLWFSQRFTVFRKLIKDNAHCITTLYTLIWIQIKPPSCTQVPKVREGG